MLIASKITDEEQSEVNKKMSQSLRRWHRELRKVARRSRVVLLIVYFRTIVTSLKSNPTFCSSPATINLRHLYPHQQRDLGYDFDLGSELREGLGLGYISALMCAVGAIL